MKATEIIRGVLDLIDQVDCAQQEPELTAAATVTIPDETSEIQTGVDTNRFKHIFAMLDAERSTPAMYSNSPNQTVAGADSVAKDAGGGLNGPKNPADIKSDSISMYPAYQAEKK
jgi:hypothetical protein